jgi:amidase
MTSIAFKPALEMGKLLRKKKISAMELLGECLTQYARHNDRINAVILTDLTRARAMATAADKRLAKGKALSPFDGVPMTIKESFDWAGHPSTWGDPALIDNIPKTNAVALDRMLASGAVVYGKTNVPLALADWQSFNAIYGTTSNPWDVTRSPGGSSGGAAAALASGMSALEIGSDIGASIRNPAHYCGVYGHKPTYGIVPYRGHLMPGSVSVSDITAAGPMARSAHDLTAMLALLAGFDGAGARAKVLKLPKPQAKSFKALRVAIKLNSTASEVDQAYQDRIVALGEFLKKRVKKLSYEAVPAFSDAEACVNFITLLRATSTKRMSSAEIENAASKAKALDPADMSYVALMTRAFGLSHGAWLKANEQRHRMRLQWEAFFADWDVMLCPVAASAAFPHDHVGERHERFITVNGRKVSTIDQRFWAGYGGNFYLPATVAPIGLVQPGLPVGVQIITRAYDDLLALKVAAWIEDEYYAFQPPPACT